MLRNVTAYRIKKINFGFDLMMYRDAVKYLVIRSGDAGCESPAVVFCILQIQD